MAPDGTAPSFTCPSATVTSTFEHQSKRCQSGWLPHAGTAPTSHLHLGDFPSCIGSAPKVMTHKAHYRGWVIQTGCDGGRAESSSWGEDRVQYVNWSGFTTPEWELPWATVSLRFMPRTSWSYLMLRQVSQNMNIINIITPNGQERSQAPKKWLKTWH